MYWWSHLHLLILYQKRPKYYAAYPTSVGPRYGLRDWGSILDIDTEPSLRHHVLMDCKVHPASCQRYSPWRKAAEARRWTYTHTTCEHKERVGRYTYFPHVFMLWRSNQTIDISYLLFLHFSLTNSVNSVPVHIKVYRERRRLAPLIPKPVTRGWRLDSGPDRFEKGCYGQ